MELLGLRLQLKKASNDFKKQKEIEKRIKRLEKELELD